MRKFAHPLHTLRSCASLRTFCACVLLRTWYAPVRTLHQLPPFVGGDSLLFVCEFGEILCAYFAG